jgi:hypothetical protein
VPGSIYAVEHGVTAGLDIAQATQSYVHQRSQFSKPKAWDTIGRFGTEIRKHGGASTTRERGTLLFIWTWPI